MIAAGKFLTAWVVPPGIFILSLAGLLLWLLFKGRKTRSRNLAILLLGALSLLLYAASLPVLSGLALRSLETEVPFDVRMAPENAVVVIPGAGIELGRPENGDVAQPSPEAMRRLWIARQTYAPGGRFFVVSGGVVFPEDPGPAEAVVMRDFLANLGIAPARILLESESRNTEENARLTARLLAAKGLPSHVILVTSAYHMPRTAALFTKAGLVVHPHPVAFRSSAEAVRIGWRELLPRGDSLVAWEIVLRERIGLFWAKSRGTAL